MEHSGISNRRFFLIILVFLSFFVCKNRATASVGMFDSGTGGLTVLEAFLNLDEFNNMTGDEGADGLPDFSGEDFVFLADQVNMPYGIYNAQGKGDVLKELVVNDAKFLTAEPQNSKIVVIACNTATANALTEVEEYLKKEKTGTRVIIAGTKSSLKF